jgi:hypothetical protein
MPNYVALLRAVNVGGTGKLAMADLKAMCGDAGFLRAQTYIASGNVVFASKASAAKVKATPRGVPARPCRKAGRRDGAHGGRNGGRREGQPVRAGCT